VKTNSLSKTQLVVRETCVKTKKLTVFMKPQCKS